MDAGWQINTPFLGFSSQFDGGDWASSIVLGGDYFIQNNLSLRGEVYLRTFGEGQFGFSPLFDLLPNQVFRVGFNYFIEG
ncbi:MAG: hypothetical protein AAGJ18_04195 [Bacteroidota bacterium]